MTRDDAVHFRQSYFVRNTLSLGRFSELLKIIVSPNSDQLPFVREDDIELRMAGRLGGGLGPTSKAK